MTLPTAMQARRAQMESEANGGQPPAPAPAPAPAAAPAAGEGGSGEPRSAEGESVTISREEFNELQAAAGRVRAAEGRMESLEMDKEALESRLTALEAAAKGNTHGATPAPAAAEEDEWQPQQVQYTQEELSEYSDSRAFVEKVAQEVFNREFGKAFGSIKNLKAKLSEVKTAVDTTARRTEQVEGRDFNDQVRKALKESNIDFDAVVNHQYWVAFAESDDPSTGLMYADVIRNGLHQRKVAVVTRVMKDFAVKYGLAKPQGGTGYEGGVSGGGSRVPQTSQEPEMLPFSERKKAHKQWINKEITDSEYQRICDKYSAAEKEGRIDYDA